MDALQNNHRLGDEDSISNLPTLRREVRDIETVESVETLEDKDMVLDLARSVVKVSATEPDGRVILHSSGIVIDLVGQCAKILTSSSIICTKGGKLRHPDQKACTGGPVVDNHGKVIGMIASHIPQAAIVSISIVEKCIQMWNQFGRIAHPVHDLELKTVRMLNILCRDELSICYNIRDGFVVSQVCGKSAAEKVGIRRGDVIDVIGFDHPTVVELEEYLLTLALDFLDKELDPHSTVYLKIRVHDLRGKRVMCTKLPMRFSDATVRRYN